jgi:asparagine synthase (glutamine-hydrolysing)
MCGIAAIFAYGSTVNGVDRDDLRRIRDHMVTRGPDGFGEWYSGDNRVGLGHRRLAIIDLSDRGSQPMRNREGSLVISFNGEIYNYRVLRDSLERKGHRFSSASDTEVLLHLYEEKGETFLGDLRGMFAFILWDEKKKILFMARDTFGIKPLYYADNGRVVRVASQVKALLKGNDIDTRPEPAGHVGFFLWGHVPEPYTLYKGIVALPAGSSMTIDEAGNKTLRRYCDLTSVFVEAEGQAEGAKAADVHQVLREALIESVRHHLIADVPVGIFLSSGLDSSTLVALACEITPSEKLNTVTLGFKEYEGTIDDETILAEQVARHYGTRHRTIFVSKQDFINDLPRVLASMDQPTIDGINSYFVSKVAVETGLKVALSGLGGDEIFGGYPSFREIPHAVSILSPFAGLRPLGSALRRITSPILKRFTSPKYAGLLEYGTRYGGSYLLRRGLYMPWEVSEILDRDLVREGLETLQPVETIEKTITGIHGGYQKVSAMEFTWYLRNQLLRDTDWASMAHSLEVRTPFVDLTLLKTVAPFFSSPVPPSKKDMARTPLHPLPEIVFNRGKTGFVVPVRDWTLESPGKSVHERGLRGWARQIYRGWDNIAAPGRCESWPS